MPIYEYRCSHCGAQKEVMQKMSDAPLTKCPECGQETFSKQLSAAGFQLKGNGYYVTDFKNKPKTEPACAPCQAAGSCPSAH
ncbi:MAG: zinc ribbon domain-containing protein [Sideroxydans sp.]